MVMIRKGDAVVAQYHLLFEVGFLVLEGGHVGRQLVVLLQQRILPDQLFSDIQDAVLAQEQLDRG